MTVGSTAQKDVSEKSNDLPAAALSLPVDEWQAAEVYIEFTD